jgi:predicted ester cyclase
VGGERADTVLADNPGNEEGPVSLDHNKQTSRELYEAVFGRGELQAADRYLALDCVSHAPGLPPVSGTEPIKLQAGILRTAFPDLTPTLLGQVAEGDRVASHWRGEGTHTGPMSMPGGAALPPTGRHVAFEEMRIDRFADGRIGESWFIPDRLGLMAALGVLGPPPARPDERSGRI